MLRFGSGAKCVTRLRLVTCRCVAVEELRWATRSHHASEALTYYASRITCSRRSRWLHERLPAASRSRLWSVICLLTPPSPPTFVAHAADTPRLLVPRASRAEPTAVSTFPPHKKMPGNAFVYGTLMADEVLRLLIHRVPRSKPATLSGYQRYRVKGQVFPAIVPCKTTSKVQGMVSGSVELQG